MCSCCGCETMQAHSKFVVLPIGLKPVKDTYIAAADSLACHFCPLGHVSRPKLLPECIAVRVDPRAWSLQLCHEPI